MEDQSQKNREDAPEHGTSPNYRSKPTRNNLSSPGDRKSYNRHAHEDIAGERHSEENLQAFESFEDDARRKDELSHAIFVKLQEVSRYNIEIGNYEEGLASYDRCIDHLLQTLPQGPSASMFKDFLVKTVKYLNEVALKLLQEEKVKESLQLLERCLKMTHPNSFGPYPALRSLTYNHLGCCYRRLGQLDKALLYLEKALKFPLDQDIEKVETSGITHINLCAVLSQLGDHKRALEHANRAVSDCSVELIQATKKDEENSTKTNTHKHVTMLAIAYHNLATEEEAFEHTEAALQAYLRAFNVIREYNPPHHELCVKFGRAYEEAKTRISNHSFNKGANSPNGFNKRYKTSSPHASNKVIVEIPTSYNTSKPYLQNKKIVILKRQGAPQPRPILASPSSLQLTKKPIFPNPLQRKTPKLVSAHPSAEIKRLQLDKVDKGEYGFSQVTPQRNKFMLGTLDSRAAQQHHHQQEQSNQEKNPRAVSAKANTRTLKVDPTKVQEAVIKLQSFCRGRLARQYVGNVRAETPQQVYLVLVADTVKRNIENGPFSKENLYFFLMMYRLDSQLIHIHIKNLENKKFYKALVEYQVVDRSSKVAIRKELGEACERLIQHLEIHDDQIVFQKEAENAITQTTQRIDEQIDENRGSMGPRKNEEDLDSKKTKDVDKAAQTIQKHIRGKLTRDKYQIFRDKRFKVVFSRCDTIEGNVIGFRLVDRPDEQGDKGTYDLCCYNFTKAKQYKKVEIPKKKLKLEKLTMEKLLKKVEVDVKNNTVTYKPKDKKAKKDKKEKKEKEKVKNERTPKKVHEKTPDKTRKRTPIKTPPAKEVIQPTHKKKKKEDENKFFGPLDEADISVLNRYGMGAYAYAIKKVEEDSKNLVDAINKQIGIKESDTGLAPPSQWNLAYDGQLASEQPLQVARCTQIINLNTDDARYVISLKQAAKYVVGLGEKVAATDVEEGMRVGVDKDKYQIQLPLPPRIDPSVTMMTVEEKPDVTYNDVGGAKEQLERLREVLEIPLLNPEKFTELGIDPPKGVLLYGPPGTGKTLTARAVANRTEACFIRVIGSELVQKYVGEGARMVRELFQMARSKKACIIFFDEVDAIGGARFDDGAGSDNEVQRTMLEIVNQLDGFESRGNIKVLMATNRPDTLDPALLRPGRLDRKIEFGLPDLEGREHIFKIHARTMNMEKNIRFELLARLCPNATGADLRSVATEAGMYAIRARRKVITEKDMLDAIEKVIKGYSKFSATSKYMIYN